MKADCKMQDLKNRVLQVERVIGKNLTLPVLSSVLLIASGKTIKLRATNLSLGVEVEIPAKIQKEGIVAIPGNILGGMFSNIEKNDNVSLEGVDGNLSVKTNKNSIKLKGQPHDDFPTIPRVAGESFDLDIKKITEGLKSVYYSAAPGDIKPEISSVYIYTDEDALVFVATDSFRLAEKKVKVKISTEISGILIPFKNVSEIIRIFGDLSGIAKICFNKNAVSISMDDIYLTSRVIDGVFPDYRQIIPKNHETDVVLLKQDLLNALKISNVFSDKFNQVNLTIKNKSFALSSSNNDIGENNTALDAAITGADTEISFNYRYFLDCFQSINTDSVNIKLSSTTSPIVVSPVGDKSFTYLIMPMNR